LFSIVDIYGLIGRGVRELRQDFSGRFRASLILWLFLCVIVETPFCVEIALWRRREEGTV
jgi:hypothetical protein